MALICLVCTLLVLGTTLLAGERGFGWLLRWELRLRDSLVKHGQRVAPDPQLVFVGIDNDSVSIEEVDLESLFADVPRGSADFQALTLMSRQWPWSREVYALITDKLIAAGARAVVFDLLFPKSTANDAKFAAALDRHRDRVVIGSNFETPETLLDGVSWVLSLPADSVIPQTRPLDPRVAFVNFWPDDADARIRRARFRLTAEGLGGFRSTPDSEVFSSLAARAVTTAGRGDLVPATVNRDWLFRYTAPPHEGFRPISAYQLFVPRYWEANFGPGYFRDRIVLIGPSGNWQHDEHETPLGKMPGPEVHLNAINALLHQKFLFEAPLWLDLLLVLLAGAVAWAGSQFSPRPAFLALRLLGGNVLAVLLALVVYDYLDYFTAVIAPLLAFNLSGGACFVYEFMTERFEKVRTRRTLERYVSKDVVRELLDNRESLLHAMGGARRSITVLFSDLRGFTTLTESADAVALVAQLNEYFQRMVRCVFANEGTLDKFMGDGLMAHWGSIVSDGERSDACHAVRAALAMRESLRELNGEWKERGLPPLDFGVGINSGEAIVGNLGCEEKMEVSVIGDPVNLSSRIEGATKQYHVDLLIGDPVAQLLGDAFILRTVDLLRVKGRARPVEVFTVLAEREAGVEPPEWLRFYEEAVAQYRRREFAESVALCEQAARLRPDDWLIEEYLRRAQVYAVQPPGPEWSGVSVLSQK